MKFACFAATPVQVLNAVNMAWHDVDGMRGNCDLYFMKQFSGFENMLPALRSSGLFSNVYECLPLTPKKWNKPISLVVGAANAFFPRLFLKKWIIRDRFIKNEYDVLLMTGPAYLMVLLKEINKNARVWFYDDGIGSYMGNIMEHYIRRGQHRKQFLKAVFHTGAYMIQPERQYVNNMAFCQTTLSCPKFPIPAIGLDDAQFVRLLQEIFGRVDYAPEKAIIFLSQPVRELYDNLKASSEIAPEETLKRLLAPLLSRRSEVILRPHPREKEREYYGLDVDRDSALWELICAHSIGDASVLISLCSTALLSPKIMFDKEPVIIFTYKLLRPQQKQEAMDALIETVRQAYRDPSRVYNVESFEEYDAALAALCEKQERKLNPQNDDPATMKQARR